MTRRLPRATALLALLALAGCFPTVDVAPPDRCAEVPGADTVPAADVLLVGEEASVTLAVTANGCLPLHPSVLVEVDGPDGRRVPSTATLVTEGRAARVTATFTPVAPGPHQVTAYVEPSVGVARRLVTAARLAPVSVAARVDAPCARDAVTASGTWLCLAGSEVTAWRGGMQLQALPASDVVVRGDVAWLLSPGQVERYVDRGGSFLVREPDAPLAFSADGEVLPRGDDELWDVSASRVRRFRLDPSGLSLVADAPLPRGLCAGAQSAAVDETAAAVWTACLSRPSAVRLCRFELPATDEGTCREVAGQWAGFEAGALWLREAGALRSVGLDGPGVALPLDPNDTVSATPGGWPTVTSRSGRVLLPARTPLDVHLEVVETTLPVLSVSRDTVIAGGTSARVALRRTP